jgi:hypothetical protein
MFIGLKAYSYKFSPKSRGSFLYHGVQHRLTVYLLPQIALELIGELFLSSALSLA